MDNRFMDRQALSLEDRTLLCSARPVLSNEGKDRLAGLLACAPDWTELVEQAGWHGMAPLLYRHLRALPQDAVPPAAFRALAEKAHACQAWNLRLYREMHRLLDLFDGAGVPVMPLKGLYLGSLLYGDLAWRPTSDLDFLVQADLLASSERLLAENGYRKLPADQQGADYHVSYATGNTYDGAVVIEVHTALGENHVAGLDVRSLWASASPALWDDRTIWVMALPDLLQYLCLHAVKDGLASLRSLLDIALLLERFGGELPWADLERTIMNAGIQTPVCFSLIQSRDLLGAPVPDSFLAAIRPRRTPGRFLGHALFEWRGGVLHASPSLLTGPVMALQMFLWEDSLRGKLQHLRRNLLPSARLRARWTSLPSSSSILRWYPVWIWEGCQHLSRQLATRLASRPSGPPS